MSKKRYNLTRRQRGILKTRILQQPSLVSGDVSVQNKLHQLQKEPTLATDSRSGYFQWVSRFWAYVAGFSCLCSIAGLGVSLIPRLDLQPIHDDEPDLLNPSEFRLSNLGILPIRDVKYEYEIENVDEGSAIIVDHKNLVLAGYLASGESMTLRPNMVFIRDRDHWGIIVRVLSKNFCWVPQHPSEFRFELIKQNNAFHWIKTSMSQKFVQH